MLINHCPACWRVNPDDEARCSGCGADLAATDTVRLPLEPLARRSSSGALWLDDLVGPKVTLLPQAEPDSVVLAQDIDAATATPPQAGDSALRAERRAEVRRGRWRDEAVASDAGTHSSEVLVVGAPDRARDELRDMLQSFGFTVHTTADTAEALTRSTSPSLLASFVHADLPGAHGGSGIDLCGQLRQAGARASDRATLLVLVAAHLKPMDRVRAELAGCDDAIPMPITRGNVARLLDARGIRLPSDPRRD